MLMIIKIKKACARLSSSSSAIDSVAGSFSISLVAMSSSGWETGMGLGSGWGISSATGGGCLGTTERNEKVCWR